MAGRARRGRMVQRVRRRHCHRLEPRVGRNVTSARRGWAAAPTRRSIASRRRILGATPDRRRTERARCGRGRLHVAAWTHATLRGARVPVAACEHRNARRVGRLRIPVLRRRAALDRTHPDDPAAANLRAALDQHRDGWLYGYREVLGFAYLTLVRSEDT